MLKNSEESVKNTADLNNDETTKKTSDINPSSPQPPLDETESIFDDLRYICSSADLITKSLAMNCDVAQLPDGRVIVTETRKVHILYEWSKEKNKMLKISQS